MSTVFEKGTLYFTIVKKEGVSAIKLLKTNRFKDNNPKYSLCLGEGFDTKSKVISHVWLLCHGIYLGLIEDPLTKDQFTENQFTKDQLTKGQLTNEPIIEIFHNLIGKTFFDGQIILPESRRWITDATVNPYDTILKIPATWNK